MGFQQRKNSTINRVAASHRILFTYLLRVSYVSFTYLVHVSFTRLLRIFHVMSVPRVVHILIPQLELLPHKSKSESNTKIKHSESQSVSNSANAHAQTHTTTTTTALLKASKLSSHPFGRCVVDVLCERCNATVTPHSSTFKHVHVENTHSHAKDSNKLSERVSHCAHVTFQTRTYSHTKTKTEHQRVYTYAITLLPLSSTAQRPPFLYTARTPTHTIITSSCVGVPIGHQYPCPTTRALTHTHTEQNNMNKAKKRIHVRVAVCVLVQNETGHLLLTRRSSKLRTFPQGWYADLLSCQSMFTISAFLAYCALGCGATCVDTYTHGEMFSWAFLIWKSLNCSIFLLSLINDMN